MYTTLLLTVTLMPGQAPSPPPMGNPQPKVLPSTPIAIPSTPAGTSAVPPPTPVTPPPVEPAKKEENGKDEAKEKKDPNPHGFLYQGALKPGPDADKGGFFQRFYKASYDEFFPPPKDPNAPEDPEPPRRALPSPYQSPPLPGSEYQGYPLIGVPNSETIYPLMKAIYGGPWGDAIKDSGIKFTGWATGFGVVGNAKNSNTPASYWITPNTFGLDQLAFKLERNTDTVQTDHIDWGFRAVGIYGIDYRYTTAGGWGSEQLLNHNLKYGWDPTEVYGNIYIPGFLGGTDIRIGRWIACPDIETQYSVDNYLGSHSILFTFDTYTQTGVMLSQKINDQLMVQGVIFAGTDMAPWYPGATPTFATGFRWVAQDNKDAFYTWLNALNNAQFRHFEVNGQPAGHDNFNYIVTTWEHQFTEAINTKTEAYYMWEYNAEVGGTPSIGPVKPYGGGGGDGILIPGLSRAYGVLNYTMFSLSERDYLTVRNEWYRDETGFRTGYAGNYTSHTIGYSHQFNDVLMVRPEVGYYRNWTEPAFDDGTKKGTWIFGFDITYRF